MALSFPKKSRQVNTIFPKTPHFYTAFTGGKHVVCIFT